MASAAADAVLLERRRMGGGLHLRACFGDAREWRLKVKTRDRTHPAAAALVLATAVAAGNTHGGLMVGVLHPTVPQKAANNTAVAAAEELPETDSVAVAVAATSASPPQPSTAAGVAAGVASDDNSHPS